MPDKRPVILPARDLLKRYEGNPILKPRDMPAACCAVYNSGVVKTPDGRYIMASRFETPAKRQFVWVSRSRDGTRFTPDPRPMDWTCDPEDQDEFDTNTFDANRKLSGCHIGTWWDPRINPLQGEYYVTYAAVSYDGCRVGIGKVLDDFRTCRHVSFPFHPQNRNAVLFPEKIGGEYWMLHRAEKGGQHPIWIASSPDLKYWGNCKIIARPEQYWENVKIGPAAPPIRTDRGWLEVYHGVFANCNGFNYAMGAMLLDLERPWRVVARATQPILFVEETYEMIGQVPNVIFPGGVIAEPDGTCKVYYGAADYVQCLATGKLQDLMDACYTR